MAVHLGATLRLAKSIELLCATFEKFEGDALIRADRTGDLSGRYVVLLAAARRIIDER